MAQFLGTTREASQPLHLIGFHVAAGGSRFYDRVTLMFDKDGRVSGSVERIAERDGAAQRAEARGMVTGEKLALMLEFDGAETAASSGVMLDLVSAPCLLGHALDGRIAGQGGNGARPYVIAHAPAVRLDRSPTHGWGTVIEQAVRAGETILGIDGPVGMEQTPYSFRTDDRRHVEPTGYGHFVNHACEPNCHIVYDVETGLPTLVALRDLAAGDEVTFDYTRTEGELAGAFECRCPAAVHKV